MRTLHLLAFGTLLLGGVSSCSQGDVGPSDDAILQSNIATITTYANNKNLGGSSSATGVYYAVTKPAASTAIAPSNGQEVEFNYTISQLAQASSGVITDSFVDSTYATRPSYVYIVATNAGLTEGLLKNA